MGRKRLHETDADRQRAYRHRLQACFADGPLVPKLAKPRRPSRPWRLAAVEAELRSLLREYEAWLDALPESLTDSGQAAKLAETIEQLASAADSIAEIEPPRGFGRD